LKLDSIQPRTLRYRNHYKIYLFILSVLSLLLSTYWWFKFSVEGHQVILESYRWELIFSFIYFSAFAFFYFFWVRPKMKKSIQVFAECIVIHDGRLKEEVKFEDIESINLVCWSIFYLKTKKGVKHYFHSGYERVDYIWEGLHLARADLFSPTLYEDFRVKLVQYDHHQKRKDWFFKHKMVDVFNWAILPFMFLSLAFMFQSKNVIIHHQGIYFFRLFMYSMLILVSTAFFYSLVLKKFVFDKKVKSQMKETEVKVRDLEFEGMILHRSKIFQFITATFALAILVKMDVNLYSVTKVREDLAHFNLKKGHTVLIDNRYNCVGCKYQILDGDYVVFGRGTIGQVLAKEGDMVGEVSHDKKGRMIASENLQEVPRGHVAVRAANGKDIVFVKIQELIGKIQN
jgi:hypothetical protein